MAKRTGPPGNCASNSSSARFFSIARAAHYVVNEAPGEVLVDLVRYIRPLARP